MNNYPMKTPSFLALSSAALVSSSMGPATGADLVHGLVREIRPGSSGAEITSLTPLSATGEVYFSANDGSSGLELWRSNGTAAGTALVKDINPGLPSSSPGAVTVSNKILFFAADNGVNGAELWRSNGTTGGTYLVKDLRKGSAGAGISSMVAFDGRVFFNADDGISGSEPWQSHENGDTHLVRDIRPGPLASSPVHFIRMGDGVYFSAREGDTGGYNFYRYFDGTRVTDLQDPTADTHAPVVQRDGRGLFFTATEQGSGKELWRYGTPGSSYGLVADINVGTGSSEVKDLTAISDRVFFTAFDGKQRNLYASKPGGGVTLLMGLPDVNRQPRQLTVVGGRVFFTMDTAEEGEELWVSNGTGTGTYRVTDLFHGAKGSMPYALVEVYGKLYFCARQGNVDCGLWRSDGTEAGTVKMADLTSTPVGGSSAGLVKSGRRLFHTSHVPDRGLELYMVELPVPTAQTLPAAGIAERKARLRGSATLVTDSATAYFQWGETAGYGKQTNVVSLRSAGSWDAEISGLMAGRTYHFRSVLYDADGAVYGQDETFTVPSVYLPWLAGYPGAELDDDADRDGMGNAEEYAFGTSPLVGDHGGLQVAGGELVKRGGPVLLKEEGAGDRWSMAYIRRKNPAAAGLTYTALRQADVSAQFWTVITESPRLLADDGEYEVVAVYVAPAGAARGFARVKVLVE